MEERHYIEWVEVTVNGITEREFLKPVSAPRARFCSYDSHRQHFKFGSLEPGYTHKLLFSNPCVLVARDTII